MAFPGPYARIIRNDEGEPMGWENDYPPDYWPPEEVDPGWGPEDDKFDYCVELMIEREGRDDDCLYHFWKAHPELDNIEAAYAAWKQQSRSDSGRENPDG